MREHGLDRRFCPCRIAACGMITEDVHCDFHVEMGIPRLT
jgi:hypothetical protein